jgi:hypothetical protein
MNESDETALAAGYKAGNVTPNVFIRGPVSSLPGFPLKHAGMTDWQFTSCWKFWKEPGTFRARNEEVLKFYGG